MTIGELKELIKDIDDNKEIIIKIGGYCDTLSETDDFDIDERDNVVYLTDL